MKIEASTFSKSLVDVFTANLLFDKIEKSNDEEIILDFNDINFISQSFAQKYAFEKYKSDKTIKEINLNEENATMLKVVNDYLVAEGLIK